MQDGSIRRFVKYAGAPTLCYEGNPAGAVERLEWAVEVYCDLEQPNVIKLVEHGRRQSGYAAVFDWVDGECLHAHWDFSRHPKYDHPQSPNVRFAALPLDRKLDSLATVFSVHQVVSARGYVAIDFYDGSILYDFGAGRTTICDIDMYHRAPYVNEMGRMWGSSRFMSPEEYDFGAPIDEVTNVYAMGAVAFEFLGSNEHRSRQYWTASSSLYEVARRATSNNRDDRYQSICAFCVAWDEARASDRV